MNLLIPDQNSDSWKQQEDQIIQYLEQQGASPEKIYNVDLFFYGDSEGLTGVYSELSEKGFIKDESKTNGLLLRGRSKFANLQSHTLSIEARKIAKTHKVEFDGWGVPL